MVRRVHRAWTAAIALTLAGTARADPRPGDPNDPGVLEPALTATTDQDVRIPNTDQAQGPALLNLVGEVAEQDARDAMSLTGHPITRVTSPNDDLREALDQLNHAAEHDDVDGMRAAAGELEAILLGQTEGRIYDGFAMLNFNRGAYAPGQVLAMLNDENAASRGTWPAWKPFLWLSPDNGTLFIDPDGPDRGYWADLTYAHGAPIAPGASLTATIETARASGQVFYPFDPLFHDNAIFSPHAKVHGDVDEDGVVDFADLLIVLTNWTG